MTALTGKPNKIRVYEDGWFCVNDRPIQPGPPRTSDLQEPYRDAMNRLEDGDEDGVDARRAPHAPFYAETSV